MMSQIRQLQVAVNVADVALLRRRVSGDPAGWLPPPARPAGGRGMFTVEVGPGPVRRPVSVSVGDVWDAPTLLSRHILWVPDGRRVGDGVLPVFDGRLIVADGRLELVGDYEVPAGWVGAAADALVGQHVAAASGMQFLTAMLRRMEVPVSSVP